MESDVKGFAEFGNEVVDVWVMFVGIKLNAFKDDFFDIFGDGGIKIVGYCKMLVVVLLF